MLRHPLVLVFSRRTHPHNQHHVAIELELVLRPEHPRFGDPGDVHPQLVVVVLLVLQVFDLLANLRDENGRLYKRWRGGEAAFAGTLEDYAFLAWGLLELYQAGFEVRDLEAALALTEEMLAHFEDEEAGGFFTSADDAEELLFRHKEVYDGALPSGNSVAADVLLRLAILFDRPAERERAERVLGSMKVLMERYPNGFGRYLCAAEFALAPVHEIALVGEPGALDTQALADVIFGAFRPNKVVALLDPAWSDAAEIARRVPLLAGKTLLNGLPAAYVCRNYACQAPTSDSVSLAQQLGVS